MKELTPADDQEYAHRRSQMVDRQIASRGVRDPSVLGAMRRIPRHRFVPEPYRDRAYDDCPLPIGEDQTISQPYIVALMTELLHLGRDARVLEIGTGSGYQAAVLAEIAAEVYSIEIVRVLGERARALLTELGYGNVQVRIGDGYRGWPEEAPFDAIIVTAAPPRVPQPLLDQLAPGGRLVIPVGDLSQQLEVYTRREGQTAGEASWDRDVVFAVRFVPMTGEAERE
ncbi:MAG TPA: protein-L-isoaspartate(D-aspartate) O-methyltransferase [Candidatus Krumholzibacteria bacterium]|nr:protein-L-isoaspartate(D-aspartate) O-methyltransferase [Candidatus Krumholzibacteria bacterium]HPD73052.1 protein-L-isoaspartate(D-aspartate) O-methyltransferase [Candidatus Krumholzibacteria bacterium]HRY41852.1 protein-L-isoaspartate(D-aspartate) O-methyltransferase [Candidatus Krumholzibacteria bacterium]